MTLEKWMNKQMKRRVKKSTSWCGKEIDRFNDYKPWAVYLRLGVKKQDQSLKVDLVFSMGLLAIKKYKRQTCEESDHSTNESKQNDDAYFFDPISDLVSLFT